MPPLTHAKRLKITFWVIINGRSSKSHIWQMTIISLFLVSFFFFSLCGMREMRGSRTHSHRCLPLGPFGGGFCSWGPGSLNIESVDPASKEPSETNRSASELSACTHWLRIALLRYYLSHLSNGELPLWIVLFIWNWHLLSTYFVPVTCPNHFSNSFSSPNPMKELLSLHFQQRKLSHIQVK